MFQKLANSRGVFLKSQLNSGEIQTSARVKGVG